MTCLNRTVLGVSLACLAIGIAPAADQTVPALRFEFGAHDVAAGSVAVQPGYLYSPDRGYGFEPGDEPRLGGSQLGRSSIGGDRPFQFSAKVPEGNYRVNVTLGDSTRTSDTTIKAELRRLVVESAQTSKGGFVTRSFNVNVRTSKISTGGEVRLKERERTSEFVNWDEKLTLEFNGLHPSVAAIEIKRVDDVTTVYLLGDSTVCDQPKEPWNSWGQMLPRFFNDRVVVSNHAQSGESLRSSLAARRLDKVVSVMQPGDYLFIQYGHNDMKERGEGVGAFASYKTDLERFVTAARVCGGIPVLVTSMHRKSLDAAGKIQNTLNDYPEAVRTVAREQKVALIDLHALSAQLYEALGPAQVGTAFQDGTHHNNYGSYQLAKCVVTGIRNAKLDLAKHLAADVPAFDPASPDPVAAFRMPASPQASVVKPDGS